MIWMSILAEMNRNVKESCSEEDERIEAEKDIKY
jgi:hypothetical protein